MPCFHPVSSVHKDEQGLVRAHSLQCGVHELFPLILAASLPLRERPPSPRLLGCFPLKVCQPEILSVHFCWGRGEEIERGWAGKEQAFFGFKIHQMSLQMSWGWRCLPLRSERGIQWGVMLGRVFFFFFLVFYFILFFLIIIIFSFVVNFVIH